mmetsp:Transcript_48439/g.80517  ORF Transcript_48439/g.80517 Transcript_48439/m.80517 type:complete len:211 (-) Transcript_48439:145-777(-)
MFSTVVRSALAHNYQPTASTPQQSYSPLNVIISRTCLRRIRHLSHPHNYPCPRFQYIARNFQIGSTCSAIHALSHSLLHHIRYLLHMFYTSCKLDPRPHSIQRPLVILKGTHCPGCGVASTGNQQYRPTVNRRICNPRNSIEHPWTAHCEAHSRSAGQKANRSSCIACCLLISHADIFQAFTLHGYRRRGDWYARHSKYVGQPHTAKSSS